MESLLNIHKQLKHLGYTLDPFRQEDEDQLYDIFRNAVDSGIHFYYECSSKQEFQKQFLTPQSYIYVCHNLSMEVIGGFYVRANFPGRSSHIANAAYMVRDTYRSRGIGAFLLEASLHIAKGLGFEAMQFNMVLSENRNAANLYKKFGFNIIGTIPEAVRKPEGSYQDGYIMYRSLNDIKN